MMSAATQRTTPMIFFTDNFSLKIIQPTSTPMSKAPPFREGKSTAAGICGAITVFAWFTKNEIAVDKIPKRNKIFGKTGKRGFCICSGVCICLIDASEDKANFLFACIKRTETKTSKIALVKT